MTAAPRARVVVTRAREDADAWVEALRARGFEAWSLPCLETHLIDDAATRSALAAALARAAWLSLSSARGAEACGHLLERTLPPGVLVAAVGERTAQVAREQLGRVDLVSERGTGRDLAERLAEELAGAPGRRSVVTASASRGQRHLEDVLGPKGIEVIRIPVYRTLVHPPVPERRDLAGEGVDAVLVASPSAVEGLLNQARLETGVAVVTIGPTSTSAARERGLAVVAEAARPNLTSMIEALEGAIRGRAGAARREDSPHSAPAGDSES